MSIYYVPDTIPSAGHRVTLRSSQAVLGDRYDCCPRFTDEMEASHKKKKAQRNSASDLQKGRFERAPFLRLSEGLSWRKREWFEGRSTHCWALGLGLGLRFGLDSVTLTQAKVRLGDL